MRLTERFWTSATYIVSFFTSSPLSGHGELQTPLLGSINPVSTIPRGPIFKPPGGRLTGPGSDFDCSYPSMPDYVFCGEENRSCWLRNPKTGHQYNITTNYESSDETPIGIHRTYYLNITSGQINADGLNFPEAKMFNGSYPGPWIQGCWGDVRILCLVSTSS